MAFDISKAFDKVWHAGLLQKLKSCGIPSQVVGLISSSLSNRHLWVVLDGNSVVKFLKAPLTLHFSCYISINFLMILSIILLSMLMILLSTVSVIRPLMICHKN